MKNRLLKNPNHQFGVYNPFILVPSCTLLPDTRNNSRAFCCLFAWNSLHSFTVIVNFHNEFHYIRHNFIYSTDKACATTVLIFSTLVRFRITGILRQNDFAIKILEHTCTCLFIFIYIMLIIHSEPMTFCNRKHVNRQSRLFTSAVAVCV